MTFVKIHSTILDSSVWSESPMVCKVWITMLAMADEHGVVSASIDGLARRAVVSVEDCEAALRRFLGPDRFTRDDTAGERIEVVPGGWLVLNHTEYRDRRTAVQIATAERVRKHRKRRIVPDTSTDVPGCPKMSAQGRVEHVTIRNDVTPRNGLSPSEAEADTEADKSKNSGLSNRPVRLSEEFLIWYKAYPKHVKRREAQRAWDGARKQESPAKLLERCQAYAAAVAKWPAGYEQSIPHPATWLNQGRWADDPDQWKLPPVLRDEDRPPVKFDHGDLSTVMPQESTGA